MAGMVLVAPRAIATFGPSRAVAGMGVLAAGLACCPWSAPTATSLDVLPATLVAAAGMSLAFIPPSASPCPPPRPQEAGLAAGIVNTSYQVGSALGLAAMTAVAAAFGSDGPTTDLVGLTDGYSAALIGAAAIAAVGAVIAAAWLRTPATQTPAEVAADEQVAA